MVSLRRVTPSALTVHRTVIHYAPLQFPSYQRPTKKRSTMYSSFHRETGIDSRLRARSLRVLTVHRTVIHYAPLQFPPCPRPIKKRNTSCSSFLLVRETGIEPVRFSPHAPQTCASASSATPACRRDCNNIVHYTLFLKFVKSFLKKYRNFFGFFEISKIFYTKTKKSRSFALAKVVKL